MARRLSQALREGCIRLETSQPETSQKHNDSPRGRSAIAMDGSQAKTKKKAATQMGNESNRVDISIVATIARASDQYDGFIRNLTTTGAMFEGVCDLEPGENLFLEIDGFLWVYAQVTWALAPRFGLSFNAPIASGKLAFLRDRELLSYLQFDEISGKVVRPEAQEAFFAQVANG